MITSLTLLLVCFGDNPSPNLAKYALRPWTSLEPTPPSIADSVSATRSWRRTGVQRDATTDTLLAIDTLRAWADGQKIHASYSQWAFDPDSIRTLVETWNIVGGTWVDSQRTTRWRKGNLSWSNLERNVRPANDIEVRRFMAGSILDSLWIQRDTQGRFFNSFHRSYHSSWTDTLFWSDSGVPLRWKQEWSGNIFSKTFDHRLAWDSGRLVGDSVEVRESEMSGFRKMELAMTCNWSGSRLVSCENEVSKVDITWNPAGLPLGRIEHHPDTLKTPWNILTDTSATWSWDDSGRLRSHAQHTRNSHPPFVDSFWYDAGGHLPNRITTSGCDSLLDQQCTPKSYTLYEYSSAPPSASVRNIRSIGAHFTRRGELLVVSGLPADAGWIVLSDISGRTRRPIRVVSGNATSPPIPRGSLVAWIVRTSEGKPLATGRFVSP